MNYSPFTYPASPEQSSALRLQFARQSVQPHAMRRTGFPSFQHRTIQRLLLADILTRFTTARSFVFSNTRVTIHATYAQRSIEGLSLNHCCLGKAIITTHSECVFLLLTFKRRIKSHMPFACIIRSSPYSTRFQDKG